MSSRLVDPSHPFKLVYSFNEHPKFGPMLAAYVVQTNERGGFLGTYARLMPNSIERYQKVLDEDDERIVEQLDEIVLQKLYRKFKKKENNLQVFISRFDDNPLNKYIKEYIQRRIVKVLPLIAHKNVALAKQDGHPVGKMLSIVPFKIPAGFEITRTNEGLRYAARFELDGQRLKLHERPSRIICLSPPWLRYDTLVFEVGNLPDGKRIKPFLGKPEIFIPKDKEQEFFEKFLLKVVADCEIEAQGLTIDEVQTSAEFELHLAQDTEGYLTLKPRMRYRNFVIPLASDTRHHVELERKSDANIIFHKIRRDFEAEDTFRKSLAKLRTDRAKLLDFSLTEGDTFAWIQENQPFFEQFEIKLVQGTDSKFCFDFPILDYELEEDSIQIKLKAEVSFGGQKIQFERLRGNILSGEARYQLPDERYVYLPQNWMNDYRHLMEVAEVSQGGGLNLRPYQLPVLQTAFARTGIELPERIKNFERIEPVELPVRLKAKLRDYQKAGYDWLCFLNDYHLGGILADDMGLGKTIQTLALLQRERERKGEPLMSLIVLPNSIIYNWESEAARFTPQLKVLKYVGQQRKPLLKDFEKYDLILTTYGTMRRDVGALENMRFHYIVLDESHYIKNRTAKTTQAIMRIPADHRLSLTGTPIENTTMDLWTQMQFLNPGLLGTATYFERQFSIPIEKNSDQDRAGKLREMTKPFLLRRTKDMVAKDLPERVEQVHYCEMSTQQKRLYYATASMLKRTLFGEKEAGGGTSEKLQVLSALQRLRQIAIHPGLVDDELSQSGKYDLMKDLMHEAISEGDKVLIFSQFVKHLAIIRRDLKARGITFAYLDGSMSSEKRAAEVARFQEDGNVKVFLISLKAGGVGLNLTAARYVFMLDPWWNPAIEQQAINRAHRIGQKQTVFVYKFITRDSIEEKILKLQARKMAVAGEVVQSEESFFKSLNKEDLMSLFE